MANDRKAKPAGFSATITNQKDLAREAFDLGSQIKALSKRLDEIKGTVRNMVLNAVLQSGYKGGSGNCSVSLVDDRGVGISCRVDDWTIDRNRTALSDKAQKLAAAAGLDLKLGEDLVDEVSYTLTGGWAAWLSEHLSKLQSYAVEGLGFSQTRKLTPAGCEKLLAIARDPEQPFEIRQAASNLFSAGTRSPTVGGW